MGNSKILVLSSLKANFANKQTSKKTQTNKQTKTECENVYFFFCCLPHIHSTHPGFPQVVEGLECVNVEFRSSFSRGYVCVRGKSQVAGSLLCDVGEGSLEPQALFVWVSLETEDAMSYFFLID